MSRLKEDIPSYKPPQLLVGLDVGDDSAVYKLTEEIAIINTVDFFTPIVDDPYQFGAIAAANALSDVYAMGGEVILALNVCAFPKDFPVETMSAILKGGADKVSEAGGVIAGGHTVMDEEPKYGLSVTGIIHPDKIFKTEGAQSGDLLFLTKPLGVGVVATALKGEAASEKDVREIVDSMGRLNCGASRILKSACMHVCTDITGFALIGHSLELAENSGVGIRFFLNKLPFTSGVREYAGDSFFPGGTCRNQLAYESHVVFDKSIPEIDRLILFTPETSGGLLAAVPASQAEEIKELFDKAGEPCWIVGEIIEGSGIEVRS